MENWPKDQDRVSAREVLGFPAHALLPRPLAGEFRHHRAVGQEKHAERCETRLAGGNDKLSWSFRRMNRNAEERGPISELSMAHRAHRRGRRVPAVLPGRLNNDGIQARAFAFDEQGLI